MDKSSIYRADRSKSLINIGNTYINVAKNRKAIEYFEQAFKIAHEFGDRHQQCTCLGNIGGGYTNLGEYHKGIEYYEQALIDNAVFVFHTYPKRKKRIKGKH